MGRTIKLLLLFFAYQLAITSICTGAFMLWNHSTAMPEASNDGYVTFLLVVQVLFTICLSAHLVLAKYVKFNYREYLICKRPIMWLLAFTFIVGLALWNNYLNELIDLPNTMESFFKEMMSRPLGVLATVVMAPVMEELLFRGAIQGHLMRKWKNPMWAVLVSSFLFGVVHGNPAQIPFAFTIGVGLGWMYYMTGSLVPCFFMHFVNNCSAVVVFRLTDNSDATLIGTYGIEFATCLAVFGIILTLIGIWGIKKYLNEYYISWFESVE